MGKTINLVREITLYLYEKISIVLLYLISAIFAIQFDTKAPIISTKNRLRLHFSLILKNQTHICGMWALLPPINNPIEIDNAADYAGSYLGDNKKLTLIAENQYLVLDYKGYRIILERRYGDSFYINHPDFALFLLTFKRSDNQVVEAFYGSEWYASDRYTGPRSFDYPSEWLNYIGHYRSHNPWYPNFRIIVRKDKLWIIYPVWGDGEVLVPMVNGVFRIGEDERSPERIKFDTIINERALRANISGCDYYRTFNAE